MYISLPVGSMCIIWFVCVSSLCVCISIYLDDQYLQNILYKWIHRPYRKHIQHNRRLIQVKRLKKNRINKMLERNFVERNRDMTETVNRILRRILSIKCIKRFYMIFFILLKMFYVQNECTIIGICIQNTQLFHKYNEIFLLFICMRRMIGALLRSYILRFFFLHFFRNVGLLFSLF